MFCKLLAALADAYAIAVSNISNYLLGELIALKYFIER